MKIADTMVFDFQIFWKICTRVSKYLTWCSKMTRCVAITVPLDLDFGRLWETGACTNGSTWTNLVICPSVVGRQNSDFGPIFTAYETPLTVTKGESLILNFTRECRVFADIKTITSIKHLENNISAYQTH